MNPQSSKALWSWLVLSLSLLLSLALVKFGYYTGRFAQIDVECEGKSK